MPKRPRHIDHNLVRSVNPEGEDLLAPMCPQAVDSRAIIREFVREYPLDRYGTTAGQQPLPSSVGQFLKLQEAQRQALSLLLKINPDELQQILNHLIYQTDLSDAALAEARRGIGIRERRSLHQRIEDDEPYDFGGDPETLGMPVIHTPEGAFVVEGSESFRR